MSKAKVSATSADLDKIAIQLYNVLLKKELTVEEAKSVTYRVNKRIAQNSRLGGA